MEKVLVNSTKYTSDDEFYDSEFYKPVGTREDGLKEIKFADDLKISARESVFLKQINVTTNEIP